MSRETKVAEFTVTRYMMELTEEEWDMISEQSCDFIDDVNAVDGVVAGATMDGHNLYLYYYVSAVFDNESIHDAVEDVIRDYTRIN